MSNSLLDSQQAETKFQEINDLDYIQKVFGIISNHGIRVTLWLKNKKFRMECTDSRFLKADGMLALKYPAFLDLDQFLAAAAMPENANEVMAVTLVEGANLFLKMSLVRAQNMFLVFKVPNSLYKLQRRANLRIPFASNNAPKLVLLDPEKAKDLKAKLKKTDFMEFRVLDISPGGIAFQASLSEASRFATGNSIDDLRFKLRNIDILARGIIRHSSAAIGDYNKPVLVVGLQFISLHTHYETHIAQFVMEESRRMFTLLDPITSFIKSAK